MPHSESTSERWPAVGWESQPWERDYAAVEGISRRQLALHSGPYEASVPPAIATASVRLESDTVAEAEDATIELAKFDAAAGQITAPFGSILLRTESASSSEIENLTSSARQIGLAEIGETASPNARLILSNVRAMESALSLSNRLDAEAIVTMHSELLGDSDAAHTGAWRDEQVWIGGGSIGPHQASFVPPHHSRVPDAIDDLLAFAQRTDVSVLPLVAIAHAQFETIHPFTDGNGRTGRALVQAMLRAKGITQNVTVPVSAGLLTDTRSYFTALTDYREGNPDHIVKTFARASYSAVANGRKLVSDLTSVREEWEESLGGLRSDATARLIAELAFGQPVLDARSISQRLNKSSRAVYTAIDTLVERRILTPNSTNKRGRVWYAPAVLGALDEFAARTKRDRP